MIPFINDGHLAVSCPGGRTASFGSGRAAIVDHIEKHTTTYNRLNASRAPKLQDMGMAEKLVHAARLWMHSMTRKISNLLDRMALSDEYV